MIGVWVEVCLFDIIFLVLGDWVFFFCGGIGGGGSNFFFEVLFFDLLCCLFFFVDVVIGWDVFLFGREVFIWVVVVKFELFDDFFILGGKGGGLNFFCGGRVGVGVLFFMICGYLVLSMLELSLFIG